MTKPTHIALMASLLMGVAVLGACSKDAPAPTSAPETVAETVTETVKTVEKVEVKAEASVPAPVTAPVPAPVPAPVTAPVAAGEVTPEIAGKKVFTRCKACHTINEGGRNRVGPNLYGIFGRKSGSTEGFAYSKAMVAADITWTDETISAYLAKPKTYIPKNKMSFIGLKKEADRTNLIAYLHANTGG